MRQDREQFFIVYLATSRPALGHWQGDSLTHQMFFWPITWLDSKSHGRRPVGCETWNLLIQVKRLISLSPGLEIRILHWSVILYTVFQYYRRSCCILSSSTIAKTHWNKRFRFENIVFLTMSFQKGFFRWQGFFFWLKICIFCRKQWNIVKLCHQIQDYEWLAVENYTGDQPLFRAQEPLSSNSL